MTARTPVERLIRAPFALMATLVLVAGLMLSACGEAENFQQTGQAREANGEILFVADHNVMRWQDGDIEQLTEDVHAESPTWSPVGDRFAYVQNYGDFSEIVIAERDGDPLVQLTNHDSGVDHFTEDHVYLAAWGKEPDWSPIGEELVYISDKGGMDLFSRNLYVWIAEFGVEAPPYPLDAAQAIALSQSGPVYSPDGRQLALSVRQEDGGLRIHEVWLLNLETGIYDPLVTGTEGGAWDPDWSPDGEHITYIQRSGENTEVWIAPVEAGKEPYQLTEVGRAAEPVWSPDGDQIAFIRAVGVNFEVWVVDVEIDDDGRYIASDPERLFTADNIDAESGLSWHATN